MISSIELPDSILSSAIRSTCYLTTLFSKVLGISSFWEEGFVTVSGFKMHINLECTALPFLFIYIAGVLAYPLHGLRQKATGIAVGGIFLVLMNVLRIITLGMVGATVQRSVFDFIHIYLYQGAYVVVVFLAWYIWVKGGFITRPVLRFAGTCFIASGVAFVLIGLLMGTYLRGLAFVSGGLFGLTAAELNVKAAGAEILFQHANSETYFPVSVDIMDSIIFFALMTASASWKNKKGLIKKVLYGMAILSLVYLLFIVIASHLVIDGIGGEPLQDIMWLMRGVSIVTPFLLWVFLKNGLKRDDFISGGYGEEVVGSS